MPNAQDELDKKGTSCVKTSRRQQSLDADKKKESTRNGVYVREEKSSADQLQGVKGKKVDVLKVSRMEWECRQAI